MFVGQEGILSIARLKGLRTTYRGVSINPLIRGIYLRIGQDSFHVKEGTVRIRYRDQEVKDLFIAGNIRYK